MNIFKELYNYRELLLELVKRDIKIKYRRSMLGILWSILNPLMFMGVMTVIFSTVFKSSIENFPVYFLCGQVLFSFFAESTSMAQLSILGNGALIKKVYVPKYIFPLAKVCSSAVNMFFSLIAIIIMMIILGYIPPLTSMWFIVPITYVFLFSVGISMIISSLTVFFRDFIHLYGLFVTVLSYFSALFYPVEIIPEGYRGIILYNPIYVFINHFRQLVLVGRVPSIKENLVCIAYCTIAIVAGYIIFKKNENKFILYV